MIRAVLDTNVLVSALLSPRGKEASLLLAVKLGLVVPCFSEEMLTEYSLVLARPKFGFPSAQFAELITLLRERGELCEVSRSLVESPDRSDTKFIDCAFAASTDFLVTGNRRHFPLEAYGSASVVNAGQLLANITLDR